MRNAIISFVTFALIFVYSAFSFFYIDSFIKDFKSSVEVISSSSSVNDENIELAKKTLEDKKNALLLMISKEHVDDLENYLSSLDIAIKFESPQDIEEYKLLLLNSVENVRKHNATLN